jgi:hypothetical protein
MRADYLLAVDPGFDELVIAHFAVGRFLEGPLNPANLVPAALAACLQVSRVKTPTTENVVDRVKRIAPVVTTLVRRYRTVHGPPWLVCEVPKTFVLYGKTSAPSVAMLALSIGVVIGVGIQGGADVEQLEPDRAPKGWPRDVKAFRRTMVHDAARGLGVVQEQSQDVIDAQWLGIRALCRLHSTGKTPVFDSGGEGLR